MTTAMLHSTRPAAGVAARPCRRWSASVQASAAAPRPASDAHTPQPFTRRHLLAGVTLSLPVSTLLLDAQPALAEELVEYSDAKDKFFISVPASWSSGEGDLTPPANRFSNTAGLNRVVAFAPADKTDVSVSVTVTNVAADYTSLGSFGTAQTFGDNLVGSMDRSYLLRGSGLFKDKDGPSQTAKLLDAREAGGMYYLKYTVNKAGEPSRVISTVVALGNNGRWNRFYTVNASCTEGDAAQYGDLLQSVVKSFKAPPM